jgi:hypothetical protein
VFLLCLIYINAGIASSEIPNNETKTIDPDKISTTKDPEKKIIKTDSVAVYKKEIKNKSDSTQQKPANPSSMSSMSYNILFQVIYRFSFSEIFDSPARSEIITD